MHGQRLDCKLIITIACVLPTRRRQQSLENVSRAKLSKRLSTLLSASSGQETCNSNIIVQIFQKSCDLIGFMLCAMDSVIIGD